MLKPSHDQFDKSLCNRLAAQCSTYAPAHRLARVFTEAYCSVFVCAWISPCIDDKLLRHVCSTFQRFNWRNNNNNNNKKRENKHNNYIRRKWKQQLHLHTYMLINNEKLF